MRPEIFEGSDTDFRDRVIWMIRNLAGRPPRYRYLEERFGISARKWQNVCNKAQQPSVEMVAALSTVYPFFTSWMLTGVARNFVQLSPTNETWFKEVLKQMEGEPDETAFLHDYADAMYEDLTGLEASRKTQGAPKKP